MTDNAGRTAPDRSFAPLFDHAAAAARAWRAQTGGKIVGYVGVDVPLEIILASGSLPFRVGVFRPGVAAVQRFAEMGDSDVVAQLANTLLDGSHAFLDHLIIGNSPTANITLFHFLRESRRLDPQFPTPPLTFHEIHRGCSEAVTNFNLDSCRRLADRLSELGSPVNEASMRVAIEHTNARRREIAQLQALRQQDPAGISGTEALTLLAQWQLIPQSPLPALTPQRCRRPRVLFSSSDIAHFLHYPLVEAAGCTIVADDHDWGDEVLVRTVDTDAEPLRAIASRYAHQTPRAVRWPSKQRIASLTQRAITARVDGVVFWICDEDQASSWDVPAATAELSRHDIAVLNLGPQPALDLDEPALTAKVRRWLHGLYTDRREVRP